MKIKLKKDHAEFKAGDVVRVNPAHNLPRKNRCVAGYWLQQGKRKGGKLWKDDAQGYLVPFNDAEIVQQSKKEEDFEAAEDAREYLHSVLKAGDTVFTKVTTVSRSGMSRNIHCYIGAVDNDGKNTIQNITWHVARLCGYSIANDGGLKVGGCGMDMGFSVVYSLAARMFGRGETCAAYGYVKGRNGDTKPETDGGYMLSQRWL